MARIDGKAWAWQRPSTELNGASGARLGSDLGRAWETGVVSQTYSDVDGSSDPVGAAGWQERMSRWPVVRAYKRRTYELLNMVPSHR